MFFFSKTNDIGSKACLSAIFLLSQSFDDSLPVPMSIILSQGFDGQSHSSNANNTVPSTKLFMAPEYILVITDINRSSGIKTSYLNMF